MKNELKNEIENESKCMEKRVDNTKFIIQRFDNLIAATNAKGNFLLAFNTFVTGFVIGNYSELKLMTTERCGIVFLNITITALVISSIITTLFVILAIYPFLKTGNSTEDNYHSHIFFNSVSEFRNDKEYYDSFMELKGSDFEKDLIIQIYQLSKGLNTKYKMLKNAMLFVYFELLCLFLILNLIIFY